MIASTCHMPHQVLQRFYVGNVIWRNYSNISGLCPQIYQDILLDLKINSFNISYGLFSKLLQYEIKLNDFLVVLMFFGIFLKSVACCQCEKY